MISRKSCSTVAKMFGSMCSASQGVRPIVKIGFLRRPAWTRSAWAMESSSKVDRRRGLPSKAICTAASTVMSFASRSSIALDVCSSSAVFWSQRTACPPRSIAVWATSLNAGAGDVDAQPVNTASAIAANAEEGSSLAMTWSRYFLGVKVMPHLGHRPGVEEVTSGCIGQTYTTATVPASVDTASLGAVMVPSCM